MSKKCILLPLGIIIGLAAGYFIFGNLKPKVITKTEIVKEAAAIDSLNAVIKERDSEIAKLQNNVKVIKEIREVKVKEIQELPLDSNVSLLRENLAEYDGLSQEGDTLPRIIDAGNVPTVELSKDNVTDINCVFVDLKTEQQLNETYQGIIKEDSIIRSAQEEIIVNNESIIEKKDMSISSLESALKAEKKKRKRDTIIAGSVAIIFGVLNFIH